MKHLINNDVHSFEFTFTNRHKLDPYKGMCSCGYGLSQSIDKGHFSGVMKQDLHTSRIMRTCHILVLFDIQCQP